MYGEPPKAYTIKTPRAKKDHRCCECRGTIFTGEVYHLFSGVWDSAQTYKTCEECEQLRNDVIAATKDRDDWPCFGDLYEHVFDGSRSVHNPEFLTRFMSTRRKRNAPESPNGWMEKREKQLQPATV